MKHARKDYDRIQDPAGLIPKDEPVFLLRGQDKFAPQLLRDWAHNLLGSNGDPVMAEMVFQQALAMEDWQMIHVSKIPDLPEEREAT